MGIIKLNCGRCGKLMTVKEEHLGLAVRCPHCQTVVRLPPSSSRKPEAAAATTPTQPDLTASNSAAEQRPSPAITGEGEDGPLKAPPPLAEEKPSPQHGLSWLEQEPHTPSAGEPGHVDPFPFTDHSPQQDGFPDGMAPSHEPPAIFNDAATARGSHLDDAARPSAESHTELAAAPRTRHEGHGSLLLPILLLFLIPYCLATTGFIVWLLYQQHLAHEQDPLERLPDPKSKPEEGGADQVRHDLPLPEKLQTSLRQPLRIGALEVTPLKVQLTAAGDLALVMDMHNVSENEKFSPVHPQFAEPPGTLRTYIFLEPLVRGKRSGRIYGGKFDWIAPAGPDTPIGPGGHMVVQLGTQKDDRKSVGIFLKQQQEMIWRVQVRRGLVPTSHGPRSATAVIGVRFLPRDVEKS